MQQKRDDHVIILRKIFIAFHSFPITSGLDHYKIPRPWGSQKMQNISLDGEDHAMTSFATT